MKTFDFATEVVNVNLNVCENGVNGCVHSKLAGKDAVVEFVMLQNSKLTACQKRKDYIIQRAEGWLSWMEENRPGFIADEYEAHVQWTLYGKDAGEPHPKNKSDISVDCQSAFNFDTNSDEEFTCHTSYEGMMHRNAQRAFSAYYSLEQRHQRTVEYFSKQLEYFEGKVNEELSLCAQIQDFIDQVDMSNRTLLEKTKRRIDQLYWTQKAMSYGSYVQLVNQVHVGLNYKQITMKYGDTALESTYAYRGMLWYRASLALAHSLYIELQGMDMDRESDEDSLSAGQVYGKLTYQPRARRG